MAIPFAVLKFLPLCLIYLCFFLVQHGNKRSQRWSSRRRRTHPIDRSATRYQSPRTLTGHVDLVNRGILESLYHVHGGGDKATWEQGRRICRRRIIEGRCIMLQGDASLPKPDLKPRDQKTVVPTITRRYCYYQINQPETLYHSALAKNIRGILRTHEYEKMAMHISIH